VKENAGDRIVVEVQRFGRAKPGRLEFLRTDSTNAKAIFSAMDILQVSRLTRSRRSSGSFRPACVSIPPQTHC
jgi:hypothetical protein